MGDTASPFIIEKFLPTAIGTKSWELYLLSFVYLASGLLSIIAIANAFLRHPSFSWRDYKHVIRAIAFVFMFYRFIVTLVPIHWTTYGLVFFATLLPLLLQITHFSLLVVFVIWKAFTTYNRNAIMIAIGYGAFLSLLWIASFIGAKFMSNQTGMVAINLWTSVVASTIIGLFGSLQGLASYWAYSMMKRALNEASRKVTFKFMLAISVLLFFAVVRAVWNIGNLFGINLLDDLFTKLLVEKDSNAYSIFFVFYALVEAIPIGASTIILAAEDVDKDEYGWASRYENSLLDDGDEDEAEFDATYGAMASAAAAAAAANHKNGYGLLPSSGRVSSKEARERLMRESSRNRSAGASSAASASSSSPSHELANQRLDGNLVDGSGGSSSSTALLGSVGSNSQHAPHPAFGEESSEVSLEIHDQFHSAHMLARPVIYNDSGDALMASGGAYGNRLTYHHRHSLNSSGSVRMEERIRGESGNASSDADARGTAGGFGISGRMVSSSTPPVSHAPTSSSSSRHPQHDAHRFTNSSSPASISLAMSTLPRASSNEASPAATSGESSNLTLPNYIEGGLSDAYAGTTVSSTTTGHSGQASSTLAFSTQAQSTQRSSSSSSSPFNTSGRPSTPTLSVPIMHQQYGGASLSRSETVEVPSSSSLTSNGGGLLSTSPAPFASTSLSSSPGLARLHPVPGGMSPKRSRPTTPRRGYAKGVSSSGVRSPPRNHNYYSSDDDDSEFGLIGPEHMVTMPIESLQGHSGHPFNASTISESQSSSLLSASSPTSPRGGILNMMGGGVAGGPLAAGIRPTSPTPPVVVMPNPHTTAITSQSSSSSSHAQPSLSVPGSSPSSFNSASADGPHQVSMSRWDTRS